MKKTYMLTQADDLRVTPSEVLQEETLDKMRKAAGRAPQKQRKTAGKRMLICAALVCAMFMLMGAGYRVVTNYMTYVVGQGIVTQETDRVYVLKSAAETNECRIDAISMVPVQEGEHKGKWEVKLLMKYPSNGFYSEDGIPLSDRTITMRSEDGKTCQLFYDTVYVDRAQFSGYIDSAAAGNWNVAKWDDTCAVTLIPASKLSYAKYPYPTKSGVTVIAYPVAENSDLIAITVDCAEDNEDLKYWLDNSFYHISAAYLTVTDIHGDTYSLTGGLSGFSYIGGNSVCFLNRPLEAPVAEIKIEGLLLDMMGDLESVQVTIPTEGETVSLKDTFLVNHHGICIQLQDITAAEIASKHRKDLLYDSFTLHMASQTTVWGYMQYGVQFRMADAPEEDFESWNGKYDGIEALGDGYCQIREYTLAEDSLPVRFGEDIVIRMDRLFLNLSDEWTIDFTAPKDTGIPKEAIRYR